jgi:uncharacterized protein involved in exopolysaccharide biosynthesis
MAVEVESSSQIDEFVRVLKQRLWFILVPAALIITVGVAFAILVPKRYVSTAKVMLLETEGDGNNNSTKEGRVAEHTIMSPARVQSVIRDLGWDDYLGLSVAEEQAYLDRVLANLQVETPPMDLYAGRQLVRAQFKHTDARRAKEFLQLLMDRWKSEVLEKRHREVQARQTSLAKTRSELQQQLGDLGTQIVDMRAQFGIPPATVDQNGRLFRPEAPEFRLLDQAKEDLWEMEQEVGDLETDLKGDQARHDAMDDTIADTQTVGDDATDGEIRALTNRKEKIEELVRTQGWTPDHSLYKRAVAQIEALEDEIEALRQSAGDTLEEVFDRDNKAKLALAVELERKEAVLERKRDQMANLQQRVSDLEQRTQELQDAYVDLNFMVNERERINEVLGGVDKDLQTAKNQRDVLDGPAGNPFDVLEEPTQPTVPTDPNPILIILFSVFAGTAVGLGLAVVLEYSKNCFRSPGDLSRVMVMPILGTVNTIRTKGERRKSFAIKGVLALVTGTFVVTVGYVTWAYTSRPEVLPDPVLTAVSDFQEAFK